jgi:5'-nucleotidase
VKFLLTNDDGINADGLVRLARIAKKYGDVWVVAPDSQRSGVSHSVTIRHEFHVWKVDFPVEGVEAYACNAQPTDCVRVGVLNIVPGKPDFLLSGINNGYNVGSDIQYSATCGAALEGAFQGIQSIAFSEGNEMMHEVTDKYIEDILVDVMKKPLSKRQIWNINFPNCPLSECKGILENVVVSTDEFYKDGYTQEEYADGKIEFMVDGKRNWSASKGTDLYGVIHDQVTVGIVNNIS